MKSNMIDRIAESARAILEKQPTAGHDITHTLRVRELCLHLGSIEGGDPEILEASALLHDIGRPAELQKPGVDHAAVSARLAQGILKAAGFPDNKIPSVIYAIENHRYSSNIEPASLEARILQDADRLDISGAVGAAMTFAYTGAFGRQMYHIDDPMAEHREPDDKQYALDHILSKLLLLSMHTDTARDMAKQRNEFLNKFIDQFAEEINFKGVIP
jgi:uncharacterized protein